MTDRLRWVFIRLALILILCFLSLSILVNRDIFRAFDYNFLLILQNHLSRLFDMPFSLFSLAGSTEATILILILLFFYFLFKRHHIFIGLALYFLIFVFEVFGKMYINHPVTPEVFHRYALSFSLPSGSIIDTNFSYPSGHMARTSFIAIIAFFIVFTSGWSKRTKKIIALLIFSFIILMFISRIYLAEHWTSDVLGGTLLGTGIAFASLSFW